MKYLITVITFLICSVASGQSQSNRVLFLGNSYTYVNNLPQMVANAAASAGDTLIFDISASGGQTLYGHTFDAASQSKIAAGNWDFVVLQEQSQAPSLPTQQVINGVFPYARLLDSLINLYSPCGETVFYMTWGRKNGDSYNCAAYPQWQYVCTYEGMDSLLNLRYRMMADSNDAILSPVGAVWHYIRQNYPSIELYDPDESHPSVAGTYAAACCFYSTLFRKDPELITFNASLPAADATNIRHAAKLVVYDSLLTWHIGEYDPVAGFTYAVTGVNEITFTNTSSNASSYSWSFGDATASGITNPVHTYSGTGLYTVTLIASDCGMNDTIVQTIDVTPFGIQSQELNSYWHIYPNPAGKELQIKSRALGAELRIDKIEIYNSLGKKIFGQYPAAGSHEPIVIDVSFLNSGIYFLELSGNEKSFGRQKFVKLPVE